MADKTLSRSIVWCLIVASTALAAVPSNRIKIRVDSQRLTQLHEAPGVDGKPVLIITGSQQGGSKPVASNHLPGSIVVTSRPFGMADNKPQSQNLNDLPQQVEELPTYIDIGAVEVQRPKPQQALTASNVRRNVTSISKPDGTTNVGGHDLPSYDVNCTAGEVCTFIINPTTHKSPVPDSSSYDPDAVDSYLDSYNDILGNKTDRPNSSLIQKLQQKKRHMSPMEAYQRDQLKLMKLRQSSQVQNSLNQLAYRRQPTNRRPSLSSRLAQLSNRYSDFQERLRGRLATSSNLNTGENSRFRFYQKRYSPFLAQPFGRYRQARRIASSNTRFGIERLSLSGIDRRPVPSTHTIGAQAAPEVERLEPTGQVFSRRLSSGPLIVRGSESDAREDSADGRVRPFVSIVTDEGRRQVPNALYRA